MTHNRTFDEMRFCQGKVRAYKSPNALIWYANIYGIPLIAVLGVLGNLINVIVLSANGRRIPSYSYLLALSVSDCVFLIFGTFEVTPITLDVLSADPIFNRFYTSAILYVRIVSSATFKFSVLLVVAFNVERYISVCHPLHASDLRGRNLHRWRLCLTWICCLLLSIHWPLTYIKDSCYDTSTNATFHMVRLSDEQSAQFFDRTMSYVSMVGFNIVPIVVLFVLNALIIRTLRTVIRKDRSIVAQNRSEAHQQQSSRGANALLFAVVVMFLICNGPQVPGRLLLDRLGPNDWLVQTYVSISQQLIFLNASLNFCLYCLVSRRYRTLLRKTCLGLRRSVDRPRFWKAAVDSLNLKWSLWRETLRLRRSSHSSRRPIVDTNAAAATIVDIDDEISHRPLASQNEDL